MNHSMLCGMPVSVHNSRSIWHVDDSSGDYTPTDFTIGENWSITCQAFCDDALQGERSVPVTRTFRMVD